MTTVECPYCKGTLWIAPFDAIWKDPSGTYRYGADDHGGKGGRADAETATAQRTAQAVPPPAPANPGQGTAASSSPSGPGTFSGPPKMVPLHEVQFGEKAYVWKGKQYYNAGPCDDCHETSYTPFVPRDSNRYGNILCMDCWRKRNVSR